MGGKSHTAAWIVDHMPSIDKLSNIVSVFGGAANVLIEILNRKLKFSGPYIYNDKFNDIHNFYYILREKKKELIEYLISTPCGRKDYADISSKFNKREFKTDIERAAVIFYLLNVGRSGMLSSTPGVCRKDRNRASLYKRKINNLHMLRELLLDVWLENKCFRDLIPQYDNERAFFYVDPPYIGVPNYYGPDFKYRDHYDLAKLLNKVEGNVILSYYPHDELLELYPRDKWFTDEKEVPKYAASLTKEGESRSTGTELLLMNYDWKKQPKSKRSLMDAFG